MKLSELTAQTVAEYLRVTYSSLSATEVSLLSAMIAAAQSFVKGYTGLENVSPDEELVGFGDGEETEFTLEYRPVSGLTVYVDGILQTLTTDYTVNTTTGIVSFVTAPADGAEIVAAYDAVPSDEFDDLAIAAMVLVQDMWDRREYHIDKDKVNQVVEAILDLHRTNLL